MVTSIDRLQPKLGSETCVEKIPVLDSRLATRGFQQIRILTHFRCVERRALGTSWGAACVTLTIAWTFSWHPAQRYGSLQKENAGEKAPA